MAESEALRWAARGSRRPAGKIILGVRLQRVELGHKLLKCLTKLGTIINKHIKFHDNIYGFVFIFCKNPYALVLERSV